MSNIQDIDDIISRLTAVRSSKPGKMVQLSESEIRGLCFSSRQIFLSQPVLLELKAPLKILGKYFVLFMQNAKVVWLISANFIQIFIALGDIHGQYYDLLRLFEFGGYPPKSNYLFLGDYVDRGKQSIETICLLLAYKIKYPENFFLLRGNHECAKINRFYG